LTNPGGFGDIFDKYPALESYYSVLLRGAFLCINYRGKLLQHKLTGVQCTKKKYPSTIFKNPSFSYRSRTAVPPGRYGGAMELLAGRYTHAATGLCRSTDWLILMPAHVSCMSHTCPYRDFQPFWSHRKVDTWSRFSGYGNLLFLWKNGKFGVGPRMRSARAGLFITADASLAARGPPKVDVPLSMLFWLHVAVPYERPVISEGYVCEKMCGTRE
jgi:hypothetical protein